MPAKVSLTARSIVTAGFTNDVEAVNQYAADDVPRPSATRRRARLRVVASRHVLRIVYTLIALMIAIPSVAMAQAYRCAFDGETRATCCCPGQEDEPPDAPADVPSISKQCCCDVTEGAAPTSKDAATLGAAGGRDVLPAIASESIAVPALAPRVTALVTRASCRAPPKPSRRLFVEHCALLI
jgi:hypothetical protein